MNTEETFYIKISEDGPYVVYGNPSIDQEIITPDAYGNSWVYRRGDSYACKEDPVMLCRCGTSQCKPFCDCSHETADWDPTETASKNNLLDDAELIQGHGIILADNEKYCAFARFCDAKGRIWNLIEKAKTPEQKELVARETAHCPSGRLVLIDQETQEIYEPEFELSIGLIEDPGIKVSGPLWIKGGIRIESSDGFVYEVRNRVTLCRCGQSSNKPFCDGTHASIHFHDGLPIPKGGKEW